MDFDRNPPPLGSGGYKKRWLQEEVEEARVNFKKRGQDVGPGL
jgi:hypothetical protein